ncbi:hypothetical protein OKW21_002740 [Catalinimonas alkaloidigena]|uniref:hypothetical protein n=1 Tax=Catalinimonas alkaloidigena TaxID=1075417 RepID=UPI002406DBF0|nr:hypothetical protein [Catalinimonas alkaloidigena]MDF9797477.1 hypothetical protein [Catalinimonas alkaloidigena]
METIRNVVLAKEANCNSDNVLQYALKLTEKLKAKLTIGLCYPAENSVMSISANQEENHIKNAFQFVKEAYLDQANVSYRLVSCETDICDNADETLTAYLPDLFLMDKAQVHDLYAFIDRIHCPLILLPKEVQYKNIEHMLITADLNDKTADYASKYAFQIANIFSSTFEILDIGDLNAQLFENLNSDKKRAASTDKAELRIYPHQRKKITKPDLLVIMVKDKFFGLMKSFYGPSVELLKTLDIPVMIYKV